MRLPFFLNLVFFILQYYRFLARGKSKVTGQSVSGTQFAKGVYIVKASKGADKITTKIIVK
ncbi:hypothetical protein Barb6XT_00470 [Bacteroidales bacterium Barb6XT]|nr:hypothetical protein Barb6XT_00470 [Bacteroidales bacterium Barb6XT]